ncbi:polysaccharide pyruvyl transferase family protein [Sphingobacterium chuzhouense]|uniref:Polysaccharide pyruvyl transferase family protein n=1 Tax=Sphingobacterium chuzhouense TaxID=1742264 RepID=A0ABR7XTK3_9SPHI|nr:polysaccharide pyruvyl transferase family protein [Sphingobacterium chuzhouense]MBD1422505.1 polysaccharide pyruvyl transferase family protein [Sphingobacterium chuzhouense]
MMKINLIYWKEANYGDALSPRLIEELSGKQVQCKGISMSRKERFMAFLKFDIAKIRMTILPFQKIYGGIGSILSWLPKGSLVWGTGFMNKNESFKGGKVYAVRGKLTEQKLEEQGISPTRIYGDPALLLPLWLNEQKIKTIKLGLIPHWKEVDFFKNTYGERYHVIDFRTKDVVGVTREITSCEYILSSSLHGIIVAHAYGIPALWIKHGYIDTDGFKFYDYFSSVDIPIYNGFKDIDDILADDAHWYKLFNDYGELAKINNSLMDIQKKLLKAAPFPIRDKYSKHCF